MVSTISPQRFVSPVQRAASPVYSQKQQPAVENPDPAQLRQLLKRYCDLDDEAKMFIAPNNPDMLVSCLLFLFPFLFFFFCIFHCFRLQVLTRGQWRTFSLAALKSIQQDNFPPVIFNIN